MCVCKNHFSLLSYFSISFLSLSLSLRFFSISLANQQQSPPHHHTHPSNHQQNKKNLEPKHQSPITTTGEPKFFVLRF